MKFHGIDMQGEYKAQSVVDASALVWDSEDERRMVYDETTEQLWIANSSDWVSATQYGDVPQGTEMWFYEDSQPDGWLINGSAGDELLAVKGGGTYTTGGQVAGSWASASHSHSLNSHIHNTNGISASDSATGWGSTEGGDQSNDCSTHGHYHTVNLNSGGPSPGSTATDGSVSTARPDARVGIICSRN